MTWMQVKVSPVILWTGYLLHYCPVSNRRNTPIFQNCAKEYEGKTQWASATWHWWELSILKYGEAPSAQHTARFLFPCHICHLPSYLFHVKVQKISIETLIFEDIVSAKFKDTQNEIWMQACLTVTNLFTRKCPFLTQALPELLAPCSELQLCVGSLADLVQLLCFLNTSESSSC